MPGDGPVVIARTDDTSERLPGRRQTVVAVDAAPAAPSERRFVGLLATNAYRVSALDIPGVGAAVADALELTEARMHSHAGRATRTVLENLPRDLVLELEPTAARPARHRHRRAAGAPAGAGVRGARSGRSVGDRARLPAPSRFTAELPEQVADVVADAYGAEERTFEPHLAASTLARIAVSVRRAARPRSPTSPPSSAPSTSSRRRGPTGSRAALVAERRRGARAASCSSASARTRPPPTAPPCRRSAPIATCAASPTLLDGDDELTTALGHDVDAAPGEWRFRVYRRGAPAALAELLPLLDHLGLQALDEQPYTFHAGGERVHLYDIGVRVPAGVELDDAPAGRAAGRVRRPRRGRGRERRLQPPRAAGRADAGARSTIVRAYGKYLRQIGFAFSQAYIEDDARRPPPRSSPTSWPCSTPASTRRASAAPARRDAAQAEVRERRRRARSTPSPASTTTASAGPSSR